MVKDSGFGTIIDNGGFVCRATRGTGIGGGCIPWTGLGPGEELDPGRGRADGPWSGLPGLHRQQRRRICGGIPAPIVCPDEIFFSHTDGGLFFNPLGALPTDLLQSCPGGYRGWIVFLCTGTHSDAAVGPYEHTAFAGSISGTTVGTRFGDSCGGAGAAGAANVTANPYLVLP